MDPIQTDYHALESRFAAWAAAEPRVLALIVVGSRTRQPAPGPWSDLDLIALVTDVDPLWTDLFWLDQIGETWLTFRDQTAHADPELYVLFAGALKVDLVFEHVDVPVSGAAAPAFADLLSATSYQFVLSHGWRSLYPPEAGQAADATVAALRTPLDETAFFNCVSHMFLAATQLAKFMHRDEHWRARQTCDCEMRDLLFEMIAWHARAHSAPVQPLPDGRRLGRWATPELHERLALTIPGPQPQDIMPAAAQILALFRSLAYEVAAALAYTYPQRVDDRVTRWLASQAPGSRMPSGPSSASEEDA